MMEHSMHICWLNDMFGTLWFVHSVDNVRTTASQERYRRDLRNDPLRVTLQNI